MNGNRVTDAFQLKGPDSGAQCYGTTCTATWTYDARDRLTQEANGTGTTTTFTLDVIGNVTSEAPSGGTTITRTYNGQQLATQSAGGTTDKFLYDSLGNQDCKVKSTYAGSSCPASGSDLLEDWVYDYKNRLTAYRSYDGSGGIVNTVSYTNDPLDRPVNQTSTESGSTTSYEFTYLGDSNLVSKEVLIGGTSTTKKYAYDALGRRATLTEGASRYSYLHDPHGSVSLLVDYAGTNDVKASYGYTAYGNSNSALTKAAAGFNLTTNPYRYTGKRLDIDSNTLDMGARRYSRSTGRFLQYDYYDAALANLGLSLSPLTGNRYALAGGNPVNYVEVDGHWVADVDEESGETIPLLNPDTGAPITGPAAGPPSTPFNELGIQPRLPDLIPSLPDWLSWDRIRSTFSSGRCGSLVFGSVDTWSDPQCAFAALQNDRRRLGEFCDEHELVCTIAGPRGGRGRLSRYAASEKQIRHYERQLAADGPRSLEKSLRSESKLMQKHINDMIQQISDGKPFSNSIRDLRKAINEASAIITVLKRGAR